MNVAVKAKRPKYIFLRGRIYYYIRTIPPRHRHLFGTGNQVQLWVSLETDSYVEAVRRAAIYSSGYDATINGDALSLKNITFEDEVRQAEVFGLQRKSSTEIRLESIESLIQSFDERFAVLSMLPKPTPLDMAVIAGVTETPPLTIDRALEKYFEITPEFSEHLRGWDHRQKIQKFERSIEIFIERMGNIDILTFDDAIASKLHLKLKEDVFTKKTFKSDRANRAIAHVRVVVREVLKHFYQRKFTALDKVTIKKDDAGKRQEFTEAEVRLVEAALPDAKMSDEAKAIIKLSLITGCGVKELCWLTAADIFPNAKVPFINIGANALRSRVKSGGVRHREVPIVTPEGIAILRQFPNGFPLFQGEKGPSDINKEFNPFFTKTTPGKSFTSARHRMADLMKIGEVPLDVIAAIAGHSLGGHHQYYGSGTDGFTLQRKREGLEKALAAAPIKEAKELEKQNR